MSNRRNHYMVKVNSDILRAAVKHYCKENNTTMDEISTDLLRRNRDYLAKCLREGRGRAADIRCVCSEVGLFFDEILIEDEPEEVLPKSVITDAEDDIARVCADMLNSFKSHISVPHREAWSKKVCEYMKEEVLG